LTPKATEILLVLLKNAGQLVKKEELLNEVWSDTFVEEANLTQNIFTLRRALDEEGGGRKYIETVSRRGYRFVAPVRKVSSAALRLNVLSGQAETKPHSSNRPPILAVLPFINATGDQKVEYLADGLTDSIINNLSRVPKLRVMSRSAVFRYKGREVDPRTIGQELGVNAVLVGKVRSGPSGLLISVELVDVPNGWQLWGESFERESSNILEIQDEIARQLTTTLKLQLTGNERKRVTKRYTENSEAYEAYLEGRYHWSKYTREGIELAIIHFRKAIDLDANYALAYASIVDCYLRLATNYLPPEEYLQHGRAVAGASDDVSFETAPSEEKMRLRHEWDWKGAERELKRANELKSSYPAVHQWHAAYLFSIELFQNSLTKSEKSPAITYLDQKVTLTFEANYIASLDLTPDEEAQVFCTVAREQIEVGNYEAGCLVLQRWWTVGEWPRLEGLSPYSAADLLFTAGALAGSVSSTGLIQKGQKHAEALLNGSIGLFEHLGSKRRSAEGRIELARCYYRQGMFELTRNTLLSVLEALPDDDLELKSIGLVRLGVLERHAGHLYDSLSRLTQASEIIESGGPLVTSRYNHELATTLKDLAETENRFDYFDRVTFHFHKAFYEFEAIGNHRYAAVVENNHGYLLLSLNRFDEAEVHLSRARQLFDGLDDKIRRAQVDDTLARLHLAANRLDLAEEAVERAVQTLETGDEEALLAEALTTKGSVFCRQGRYSEAKGILEGAHRVAERCGDSEGAGRALLIVLEEMCEQLEEEERQDLGTRLDRLLGESQQASIRIRLRKCLEAIAAPRRGSKMRS
jgi:TolB-like protein/Tfp pilus assembly protein PilF